MSTDTPLNKPTLATLPPELMRLIISDPFNLGGINPKRGDPYCHPDGWLGIKLKYEKFVVCRHGDNATEAMRTLRALSQTCRGLRDFTLPLIWKQVGITTVDQLGRFREVLRAVPSIAAHVTSFGFAWNMGGAYLCCEGYTQEEAGSLLDLAFIDRMELWNSLREKHGCTIESDRTIGSSKWFTYDGRKYDEPALPRKDACSGPDGEGPDKLIKSPRQFNECITEVISQLPNLRFFCWGCSVTPMPEEALAALVKLDSLTSVHLTIANYRRQAHNLPYWELTRNLRSLSLTLSERKFCSLDENDPGEERDEATHASFALPAVLPTSYEAINSLHSSIVSRTIIAAARNGYLGRLDSNGQVQPPFAMRALLPIWVRLNSFKMSSCQCTSAKGWALAALDLRPLLSHASLWLTSDTLPRHERLLTRQDIQSLEAHFKLKGMPEVTINYWRKAGDPHPVEAYLKWLAEDEKLAQQVANAWNSVVKRGQAEKIECSCDKCEEERRKNGRTLALDRQPLAFLSV